jgi:hypothetical protein
MAIPGGPALADTSISGLPDLRLLRELARGTAVATSTQRSYGKRSHWLCFGPHDKCPAFACLAIGLLLEAAWLFACLMLIALDVVRNVRWRRDYEASLCRLIRSIRRRESI